MAQEENRATTVVARAQLAEKHTVAAGCSSGSQTNSGQLQRVKCGVLQTTLADINNDATQQEDAYGKWLQRGRTTFLSNSQPAKSVTWQQTWQVCKELNRLQM